MLQRLPEVLRGRAVSRSTHYRDIENGLWTRPVVIGTRAVAWPGDECEALIAARIAGKSPDEIRDLVKLLEEQRTQQAAA